MSEDKRIEEWEVVSAEKEYIVAKPKNIFGMNVKLESDDIFRLEYDCENYKLFLSKDDVEKYLCELDAKLHIMQYIRRGIRIIEDISADDLRAVYEIFQKYDKTGMKYHE